MQITVSTTSKEQRPHPHIDNLLLSKTYDFYGLWFILETEQPGLHLGYGEVYHRLPILQFVDLTFMPAISEFLVSHKKVKARGKDES